MAVTLVDLTFDLADLIGTDFDTRRTKVWIETNVDNDAIVDPDTGTIRLGDAKVTLNSDGTGTVADLWATNSTGTNPTGWQYRVWVDYARGSDKRRAKWTSGWFSLTATSDLADVVEEQFVPPTYLSTVTELLDGYVADAEAARDAAVDISNISTSDEVVEALVLNTGGTGPLTRGALAAVTGTVADRYALERLDRLYIGRARQAGGDAAIAYADATELTKDWADLTGWSTSNAQVSGNRLYAINSANPGGALKSFPVGAGERAHFQTLIHWKAGGAAPIYFGIDTGSADHALAASSPDGYFIGLTSTGLRATFVGSNNTGVPFVGPFTVGSNPTVNTTYLATVEIDDAFISMTLKAVGTSATDYYSAFINRASLAAAGKSITNISLFLFDTRGTSGHGFGPVIANKSLQPARTKSLGGQTVEGADHRTVITATASGADAWRIEVPKTYDARRPCPVVIFCHQSLTGDLSTPWDEARTQPLTSALTNAGYVVAAASDGGDRWGNQASLDNYLSLYRHVRDRFNTGPVFMIGVSMGFLSVLNSLVRRAFPTPAAVVSIGGVANLDDLWAQADYDDGIAAAYGISSPDAPDSEYETKTEGFNPIDREGWEFRGVPMRFYTSTGDTTVPKATGVDVLAAKVLPYTSEATVSLKSGGHLDASQYPPTEIVDFFNAYR